MADIKEDFNEADEEQQLNQPILPETLPIPPESQENVVNTSNNPQSGTRNPFDKDVKNMQERQTTSVIFLIFNVIFTIALIGYTVYEVYATINYCKTYYEVLRISCKNNTGFWIDIGIDSLILVVGILCSFMGFILSLRGCAIDSKTDLRTVISLRKWGSIYITCIVFFFCVTTVPMMISGIITTTLIPDIITYTIIAIVITCIAAFLCCFPCCIVARVHREYINDVVKGSIISPERVTISNNPADDDIQDPNAYGGSFISSDQPVKQPVTFVDVDV